VEDYPRSLAEFEAFRQRQLAESVSGPAAVARWFSVSAGAMGGRLGRCAGCCCNVRFARTRARTAGQKNGAGAIGLQRVLGLGSYDTARTWLHELGRVMVRPGRDRLSGVVEMNEMYWGSEEENVRGSKRRTRR